MVLKEQEAGQIFRKVRDMLLPRRPEPWTGLELYEPRLSTRDIILLVCAIQVCQIPFKMHFREAQINRQAKHERGPVSRPRRPVVREYIVRSRPHNERIARFVCTIERAQRRLKKRIKSVQFQRLPQSEQRSDESSDMNSRYQSLPSFIARSSISALRKFRNGLSKVL